MKGKGDRKDTLSQIPLILLVAGVTAAIGYGLILKRQNAEHPVAEGEHGAAHGAEPEEEEEEEEPKTIKDVQVVFGICVVLVAVTIFFEARPVPLLRLANAPSSSFAPLPPAEAQTSRGAHGSAPHARSDLGALW
jgi:hypothetical protein